MTVFRNCDVRQDIGIATDKVSMRVRSNRPRGKRRERLAESLPTRGVEEVTNQAEKKPSRCATR